MPLPRLSPRRLALLISFLAACLSGLVWVGWRAWGWWRATPAYQFRAARARWEARNLPHYRMVVDYGTFIAQCHYDIEVSNDRVVQLYGGTCLSNATTPALTVNGIFTRFERYVDERVCSSNGCYCEGTYTVKAKYDPEWGYPIHITTEFRRGWLDDVLNLKLGVQECRRTDPEVEEVRILSVRPLP
jgi:hypothetical protein